MNKRIGWTKLWAVLIALAAGGCGEPYLLTAEDVVCPADEETTLVSKLEKRGVFVLNEGLPNQDVVFYVNDELVGTARTLDEGYAEISWPGTQAGTATMRAVYSDPTGDLAQTTASIFTWNRDEPILVTDIDDTLCLTQEGLLIGISYDDYSKPLPGSPEAMSELAKSFKIIYLTARPREVLPKTKRWLENNGFPDGPVLTWDIDRDPWSQLGYKELRLDRLTEIFSKITIGIGNTEKDITAYRDHSMFSVLIDPESGSQRIDGGVKLPDWTKVLELFQKNPQLLNLQSPDEPIELP